MNRRDTILIAVLINCGLLAVLLMTAMRPEKEDAFVTVEEPRTEVAQAPTPQGVQPMYSVLADATRRDELDEVLQDYTVAAEPSSSQKEAENDQHEHFVTVTVKQGDYLEKIAKANGTTVRAIMKANDLASVRIDVGQVLRIPLAEKTADATKNERVMQEEAPQYYTMKSGDNPWKIAKQFHVKFNDLLNMNELDEERARNLRPGDILRVQ